VRSAAIDELLGLPARLAIVATVADGDLWTFSDLGKETGLADGNLYVQTGKLVDAGYLGVEKTRRKGRSVTCYYLTGEGRARLRDHVMVLEDAIARGRSAQRLTTRRMGADERETDGSRVW
jgi:DNA-binding PadR family transcriptional regulator